MSTDFETVDTIGEWAGRVRLHGIKPEYIDRDHPEETFAYFSIEGREADLAIPRGRDGEKGEKGDPAEPFLWQPAVSSRTNLPEYLSGADAGKAWIVRDENALVYWTGNTFVTVADVLIPGPRGPQGVQGVRGREGPVGPVGPIGPAGNISESADYDGSAAPGDLLAKSETGWTSVPYRAPRRYVIPAGSFQSVNSTLIQNHASATLASMSLPPLPYPYTIGVSGSFMVGHAVGIHVDIEVRAGDALVGIGYGDNTDDWREQSLPVTTTAPTTMTPESVGAGVVPANTPLTLTVTAKRHGLLGRWNVNGEKSNLEITIYPQEV